MTDTIPEAMTDTGWSALIQRGLDRGDLTGDDLEFIQDVERDGETILKGLIDEKQERERREYEEAILKNYQKIMERNHMKSHDILRMGAGAPTSSHPRVKTLKERYSTERAVGKHYRTGRPVQFEGRDVCLPSELDKARIGAMFKRMAKRHGLNIEWTDHDSELYASTFDDSVKWAGEIGGRWETGVPGSRAKALLDDAGSGGQEISPEFFDSAIIQFPLLHSEILPYVDIRDVPRGSSVEGASIGNPTLTWGNAEGSSLTLFDTTSLIAAIDTTIHPVAVGIEIGRDFLSDAAVDVGSILLENIGERFREELDKVITSGNGTTQPQGVTQASGTTDITAETPTTGPVDVDDLLNLMFGVSKQYRIPSFNPRYAMTDTTYKRHRSLATGVTGDERLLHGMSVQSYSLLESPVSIEQQGLSNNELIFGAWRRYRLYRRLGMSSRFYSDGETLARKNTTLLMVRGRFGGRVMDASGFAVMDSAPA
jgi:HK97 family phage major capsid protein